MVACLAKEVKHIEGGLCVDACARDVMYHHSDHLTLVRGSGQSSDNISPNRCPTRVSPPKPPR
jgi:hypothetical protein